MRPPDRRGPRRPAAPTGARGDRPLRAGPARRACPGRGSTGRLRRRAAARRPRRRPLRRPRLAAGPAAVRGVAPAPPAPARRSTGDVVHATSLAVPPPGDRPLVVTVHDLVPVRAPELLTRRGVAFHRRRPRPGPPAAAPRWWCPPSGDGTTSAGKGWTRRWCTWPPTAWRWGRRRRRTRWRRHWPGSGSAARSCSSWARSSPARGWPTCWPPSGALRRPRGRTSRWSWPARRGWGELPELDGAGRGRPRLAGRRRPRRPLPPRRGPGPARRGTRASASPWSRPWPGAAPWWCRDAACLPEVAGGAAELVPGGRRRRAGRRPGGGARRRRPARPPGGRGAGPGRRLHLGGERRGPRRRPTPPPSRRSGSGSPSVDPVPKRRS